MRWGRKNEMLQAARMLRDTVVHYALTTEAGNFDGIACGNASLHASTTQDPTKVTCRACLGAMKKK